MRTFLGYFRWQGFALCFWSLGFRISGPQVEGLKDRSLGVGVYNLLGLMVAGVEGVHRFEKLLRLGAKKTFVNRILEDFHGQQYL